MKKEVLRYLICGTIAALFALGTRVLFSLALPFAMATFCAQIVAMVFGYFLYRYVVWTNTTRPVRSTILPFIAVNLASLAAVLLVSVTLRLLLIRLLGKSEAIDVFSHASGIAAGAGLSLVGHRTFTFR